MITTINAQVFPDFGKPTKEQINLNECSFDKEAIAVVLLDQAVSNFNDEYNLVTERHVRIKILKDKGVSASNISIPFYRQNNFENITGIEGLVWNSENGSLTSQPLDRKNIYLKKVSEYMGEVSFAFPAVKAGSILDYKYRSTMKHYGGLRNWNFQREIPVLESKYMLYIIPNTEFSYRVFKRPDWVVNVKPEHDMGRISFSMENVPALGEEPYMDSRRENLQRVAFQLAGTTIVESSGFTIMETSKKSYMSTWEDVVKELTSSNGFGKELDKDLSGTQDLLKQWRAIAVETERMNKIYNHVRKSMNWNGYQGKYTDGIKSAWTKKTGHNGEINLILVNLLKSAGLQASPMLVCERHYGKVSTETPFVDQFNTVYAVVIINDKKYFLDAVDEFTPFYITPFSILNTTGLIVNKKNGGIITIADESNKFRENISFISTITPDGKMTGQANLLSHDYARVVKIEKYKKDYGAYLNSFRDAVPNGEIDSMEINNTEIDSLAMQHKFNFSLPLNQSGDYVLVPTNLFTGFQANPFLSDKRLSDINFGYRREIKLYSHLVIPDNYSIDAVPKSIQLVNIDKTVKFTRQIYTDEKKQNTVIRLSIEFEKSFYTAEEYSEIKEFYKKMFDLLNEQIVLKKK